MPLIRARLAQFLAFAGRSTDAEAELLRIANEDIPESLGTLAARTLVLETALLLDRKDVLRAMYERVLSDVELIAWAGPGVYCGSVARWAGLAAERLGDLTAAEAHLAMAVERNDRAGARRHAEASRNELARVRAAREGEGKATRSSPPSAAPSAELAREAEIWRSEFEGRRSHVPDARGLHYLAKLLAQPHVEHHVLDLAGLAGAEGLRDQDGAEVLDARAKTELRERVRDLRETVDEAEADADLGRATRARAELEAIEDELARSLGLGGRSRRSPNASSRARVAVTLAIKRAIKAIEAVDAPMAQHLDRSIVTGTRCSYRPEIRAEVRWRVRM